MFYLAYHLTILPTTGETPVIEILYKFQSKNSRLRVKNPKTSVTIRSAFRQRPALCSLCPARGSVSASGLAHREFGSNGAGISVTQSVRSNSPGIAYAGLKQVPDRLPDNSAPFANSPSLASRLTQTPLPDRGCRAPDAAGRLNGYKPHKSPKLGNFFPFPYFCKLNLP